MPIVNRINPIPTFQPNPIKAICNIIESTTISLKLQSAFKLPQTKLSCISHLYHLCLWYEGPTNNCEDYMSRSSSLCTFLSLSVISSILSSSIWQLLEDKIPITEVFSMWRQIPSNCDSSAQRTWHKDHTWDHITFRRSYSKCETRKKFLRNRAPVFCTYHVHTRDTWKATQTLRGIYFIQHKTLTQKPKGSWQISSMLCPFYME